MPYSLKFPEEKAARAYGHELRTSWKNSINICIAIQGMPVRKAEAYLEAVINLEKPVKMVRRNRKIAAKPGIGRGRYPVKSAERTLRVLRNAINNAEYQGLDPDKMVITHAQAYKGRSLKAFMPRAHGRATKKNEETTNLEIFIVEQEEEA
ncbi:MAG: 50S ribosomal protein L22 [Euryarchaeota archaeon]|nr:50S ribosomal protein L22 [Euryarchaeota archaeon]